MDIIAPRSIEERQKGQGKHELRTAPPHGRKFSDGKWQTSSKAPYQQYNQLLVIKLIRLQCHCSYTAVTVVTQKVIDFNIFAPKTHRNNKKNRNTSTVLSQLTTEKHRFRISISDTHCPIE
jgi:hypothetical protein